MLGLLPPIRSMVDVGCGVGTWAKVFQQCGVVEVVGIDGSYVDKSQLRIPLDAFKPTDLSKPMSSARLTWRSALKWLSTFRPNAREVLFPISLRLPRSLFSQPRCQDKAEQTISTNNGLITGLRSSRSMAIGCSTASGRASRTMTGSNTGIGKTRFYLFGAVTTFRFPK